MNNQDLKVVLHTDQDRDALNIFQQRHCDFEVETCADYAGLPAVLERFKPEVVYSMRFDGTPTFPREALFINPSIKWISVGGSGIDHLGLWDGDKVVVTNAAGVAADMMAQYAIGGMLSFTLRLPFFAGEQQAKHWGIETVEPIDGKTVLIVGLGATGKAVAARAKALGLGVVGVRSNPQPTENVDEVHPVEALPNLWGRADFIVVCVPLLASTKGLVDETAFSLMKNNAVLIDVSRGSVVSHSALMSALDNQAIKGAMLDVFEVEPLPQDHPLWNYGNVIITPHCSSVYEGWENKSVELFCDNLSRYRKGEPLTNVVIPERGY